jgi:tetratricopeptide (TPR) repeat protein
MANEDQDPSNSTGPIETLYVLAVFEILQKCFDVSGIGPGQISWSAKLLETILTANGKQKDRKKKIVGVRYFSNLHGDLLKLKNDPGFDTFVTVNLGRDVIEMVADYLDIDYKQFNKRFASPAVPAGYLESRFQTNILQTQKIASRLPLLEQLGNTIKKMTFPVIGLSGMPGVGKTTLAINYAETNLRDYPGGCWNLTSSEKGFDIREALKKFAEKEWSVTFSPEESKDNALAWRKIKQHLEEPFFYNRHHLTLLIFDNVEYPDSSFSDAILDANLLKHVHILFTTRYAKYSLKHVQWLPVDNLTAQESTQLLSNFKAINSAEDEHAAVTIAEKLEGFALALDIVGVQMMLNRGATYADMLLDVEAEGLGFIDGVGSEQAPFRKGYNTESLARLALPLFKRLSNLELRILDYVAWLAPDQIYLPWLEDLIAQEMPDEFKVGMFKTSLTAWQKAIIHLTDITLLKKTSTSNLMRVHRVWQEIFKQQEERKDSHNSALLNLANYAAQLTDRMIKNSHLPEFGVQLPPLVAFVEQNLNKNIFNSSTLNNLGVNDIWSGNYIRAREWLLHAIAIDKETFGENHQRFGNHYSNLGFIESELGNFAEGKDWLEKAIEIDKRYLPEGHASFGMHYLNLSNAEFNIGNYQKAKEWAEKGIAIDEKNYPRGHSQIAVGYAKLSHIEHRLGNYKTALYWAKKAFSIDKFNYPVTHPMAAAHYNNVGYMEIDCGNFAAARTSLQKSMDIYRNYFKDGHPDLNNVYFNMASLEINQGKWHEALGWFQKCQDFILKKYGKDSIGYARILAQIGNVELNLNNYDKARELLNIALALYDEYLEPNHPDRLPVYYSMSALESTMCEHESALVWLKRAHEIETSIWGDKSLSNVILHINIGAAERAVGDLTAAKSSFETAISIAGTGDSRNPKLSEAYGNLALVEMELDADQEALKHIDKAISLGKKAFRSDHPQLATYYAVLGLLERKRKSYSKAKKWTYKSIKMSQKNLHPGDQALNTRYHSMGIMEKESGNPSAAVSWIEKAIASILLNHLHANLGVYYQSLAEVEELLVHPDAAAAFYKKAYHVFFETIGEQHERTLECLDHFHRCSIEK